MDDHLEATRRAVRAGAAVALDAFRESPDARTKAHKNDLVSDADRAAQDRVVETIREESDAPVVGEEDGARSALPDEGLAWVVDPIDGTANYLRGIRLWTTSVAAVRNGEPVAGASALPAVGDEYLAGAEATTLNGDAVTVSDRSDPETFAVAVLGWGPRNQRASYAALAETVVTRCGDMRRLGSMQTSLALVAAGRLDAAMTNRRPNPWDSVAGAHLVRRAGGTVTDLEGERWGHDSDHLVASNGEAHDAVLEVARDALERTEGR
ncbi:MAG: inositol monophosphatase [Halorientalis sp.]